MGWIGVDLDGTLAEYHGWRGEEHIGDPIQPMLARVKQWLAEGKEVRIFTARVHDSGDNNKVRNIAKVRASIEGWCEKHLGQVLQVTNVKDYGMIQLWDDRCVQVIANTGIPVGDQI